MNIDKVEKGFFKSILILLSYTWRLMISKIPELILYSIGSVIIVVYSGLLLLYLFSFNLELDPVINFLSKMSLLLVYLIIICFSLVYSSFAISKCFYRYVQKQKSGYKEIVSLIKRLHKELVIISLFIGLKIFILLAIISLLGLLSGTSLWLIKSSESALHIAGILLLITVATLFTTLLLSIMLLLLFILIMPIVSFALEKNRPLQCIYNTFEILKKYFFRNVVFIYSLYYYLILIFMMIIIPTLIISIIISFFMPSEAFEIVFDIITNTAILILASIIWIFIVGTISLYYYQLKVVYEGYDLSSDLNAIHSTQI